MLRRSSALAGLALALTVGAAAAPATAGGSPDTFPERLELPNGFWPEGIAIGPGPTAWIGSIADGDIYELDLKTGAGKVAIEGPGTAVAGLKLDDRERLFVAAAFTGDARVYDIDTGEELAAYNFSDETSVINDVVLTRRAAWFTDSYNATLYGVPLGRHGRLADPDDVVELTLSGDWVQTPDQINANGIARTPDGRALLVVNSHAGRLYRVDPKTGEATEVDLGGESVRGGDGLLLLGRTLYVARNEPEHLVAEFELNRAGTEGELVERVTHADFDSPTTIDTFGEWLYLPNARFGTPPGPDVEYWVTRIDR